MLDVERAFAEVPVLETERFVLRPVREEDAADLFAFMGDPRNAEFLVRPPLASIDEAHQRVLVYEEAFADHTGVPWMMESRESGHVVGSVALWRASLPDARAEIGYELLHAWWGRGAMREALAPVLRHGFEGMGMHRLEARMDPANERSRRLAESAGFTYEGTLREDTHDPGTGAFVDTAVLALLASEWRSRRL
jgi:ribosomal-protein-alanine N-acetyltransferase